MVEQEAVNFEVAGSSPASGAKEKYPSLKDRGIFLYFRRSRSSNRSRRKPRFANRGRAQELAQSTPQDYMREGAILRPPEPSIGALRNHGVFVFAHACLAGFGVS